MSCPACKHSTLTRIEIDPHLSARECSACGGFWISSPDYFQYLERTVNSVSRDNFTETQPELQDSLQAKLCVDCGCILTKFKVGHGLDFYLDYCGACQGVWLDKNEWHCLKRHGLHHQINKVFTTQWQNQIKEDRVRTHQLHIYSSKIGADFAKVRDFKDWLDRHPQRSMIYSYLQDKSV